MSKVEIKDLNFEYKQKKTFYSIFSNLNAVFDDHKINVIVGKNGCGKTTLLKCIAGLLNFKGSILFDDVDISYLSIRARNVSYVSQNLVLYPHLNVFQNIANPLMVTSASSEEIKLRVNDIAKMLKIDDLMIRKPKEISIGQAQRVALARAIIKRPNIYLLDEPFSNLDEQNARAIREDLKHLFYNLGSAVIYVTHNIEEALYMADTIFVMDEGQFVWKGKPEQVFETDNKFVRELFNNAN